MSSSISSVGSANPYAALSTSSGAAGSNAPAASSQGASPSPVDAVSLSDKAQFQSLLDRYGMKVEGGTLGQLFSPAFFSEADANSDARLSSSEFTSLVEKNGGTASQANRLYQGMGGGDDGLSYAQFRQGIGQGDAKDFFNQLVMSRIKGSGSTASQWLQNLAQLGSESDAAASRMAKEINR
jgi:hypothetical protein